MPPVETTSLRKQTTHLFDKVADRRSEIDRLKAINQQFEEVCNDYEECIETLERLGQQSSSNRRMINEYKRLRESLETEIIHYLNRTKCVP